MIKTFINPKGHQNLIKSLKVTAILLKGWISPVGGASAVEGLQSTGLPRLVLKLFSEVHCMDKYLNQGSAVECTAAQPSLTKSPEEEEKAFYIFSVLVHRLRDSVSPVCGIFLYSKNIKMIVVT